MKTFGKSAANRFSRPIRILVVDDDVHIRKMNSMALKSFGFETEIAGDGAEAWDKIQNNDFKLLLTDHNMPKITGMNLIKKIRDAHLPLAVVLASGTPPMEELKTNPDLHPFSILPKPYSVNELLNVVNKTLLEFSSLDVNRTTPDCGSSELYMNAIQMTSILNNETKINGSSLLSVADQSGYG